MKNSNIHKFVVLAVILLSIPSILPSIELVNTNTLSYSDVSVPQIKPRYVRKVERETAKRERDKKKGYQQAVKENQQRSIEIQTPEIQEHMKQNKKNANAQAKAKRKMNKSRTKNNAKKFR